MAADAHVVTWAAVQRVGAVGTFKVVVARAADEDVRRVVAVELVVAVAADEAVAAIAAVYDVVASEPHDDLTVVVVSKIENVVTRCSVDDVVIVRNSTACGRRRGKTPLAACNAVRLRLRLRGVQRPCPGRLWEGNRDDERNEK